MAGGGEDPIPPGELAGLQAFELRVGAYAGQRYPERPLWVELDGRRVDVASVETEWHTARPGLVN